MNPIFLMTRIGNQASLNNSKARQQGFSLIELMIAATLGLLVLGAIGSIYLGSRQTFRMQEDNARLQETGRYALEVLGRSIRKAGFWNTSLDPINRATGFVGAPIAGVNGAAGAPDTLTVQYDAVAGDRDCEGTNAANVVVTDAYRFTAPNLECDGIDPGTVPQPLVSDIEDIQIIYGIDTNNDQSVDRYSAAPANFSQVLSARVCVQARSANSVNNAPQRFLNCGGALGTTTGAAAFTTASGVNALRLRRTFVATYNLRNRVTSLP